MKIKEFANLKDTKKFFHKHKLNKSIIRKTPWFYSLPIAVGTYLGETNEKVSKLYKEAIEFALQNGMNFIDSAIVYRDMLSERDIGKVLKKLINKKIVKRSEIIISTKGGIIPGDYDLGLSYEQYLDELVKQNIIKVEEYEEVKRREHTLSNKFFQFCINKSRENLGIKTIDIHYIHNPEMSKVEMEESEFYKKIENLFNFYEDQVERGNIRFYGMATWFAFSKNPSDKMYISLEKIVDIAKIVAGTKNHFKFVQMPYNIKFNDAVSKKTQLVEGKLMNAVDAANELGIYVTNSASLAQSKEYDNKLTPEDFLSYVINTKGIFCSMVGTKKVEHIKKNLSIVKNNNYKF
ncbi:aldo/keto reductase [Haloimpatiens sp. FM7330]|uniref:aldo/keto reductase n=1 Tax=Haloimpatiens sp. FM7330 TaxID=3298610 RepID=UPI00363AD4AE